MVILAGPKQKKGATLEIHIYIESKKHEAQTLGISTYTVAIQYHQKQYVTHGVSIMHAMTANTVVKNICLLHNNKTHKRKKRNMLR